MDELRGIFACARDTGRRVTLRSGGHSFDRQALGDDLVVSMSRFDSIEPSPEEGVVRVGPGATWGDILARLQPLGLVPAVTVTTKQATPGRTSQAIASLGSPLPTERKVRGSSASTC